MSDARDLLAQARRLVHSDPRRPRQTSLRSAVYSAYYALFHLLVGEAVRVVIPGKAGQVRHLRRTLSRCFEHRTMASAARAFAGQGKSAWVGNAGAIPPELAEVARTFVDLQEARHLADYDKLGPRFTRSASIARVAQCERAFTAWASVRSTTAARAFLLALLFKPRN